MLCIINVQFYIKSKFCTCSSINAIGFNYTMFNYNMGLYTAWHVETYNTDHTLNSYINGVVQERCNSIAYALELHLSCTTPLIYHPKAGSYCNMRCPNKTQLKLQSHELSQPQYIIIYFRPARLVCINCPGVSSAPLILGQTIICINSSSWTTLLDPIFPWFALSTICNPLLRCVTCKWYPDDRLYQINPLVALWADVMTWKCYPYHWLFVIGIQKWNFIQTMLSLH